MSSKMGGGKVPKEMRQKTQIADTVCWNICKQQRSFLSTTKEMEMETWSGNTYTFSMSWRQQGMNVFWEVAERHYNKSE